MRRKNGNPKTELPPTPRQCPKCGSPEVILHGALRSAVRQTLHNGQPVGHRAAGGKRDIVWERLSCSRCGAECQLSDERILELQEEVERLQHQLAFVTGRLVSENRLPC